MEDFQLTQGPRAFGGKQRLAPLFEKKALKILLHEQKHYIFSSFFKSINEKGAGPTLTELLGYWPLTSIGEGVYSELCPGTK